jgi:DNA polymerase delta subunit 1
MLEMTRTLVTEKFSVMNGYPADAHVLYGDTDSVMISFGVKTIEETMKLGREGAEYVSTFFEYPISLCFEKVYSPFLLMAKKRYAGLLWLTPDKHEKIDCKGIETVRRDNCPLVKEVVNNVLKKILVERSYEEAINYCKSVISDLLQNRIDLSMLVISKGLGKKMKKLDLEKKTDNLDTTVAKPATGGRGPTYLNKQPHVELAAKMMKRDAASAPSVGDRVAFVMIKGAKGAKGFEKSEDPLFVLENNLPLDYNHYLEHQLK